MCLIVFAYHCHPVYRLILGANRDEFRDRPTDTAHFWSDSPHVLAGRDNLAGGTWLGITKNGSVAAVTNYRDPRNQVVNPSSRGNLVASYLRNPFMSPQEFHGVLNRNAKEYDGFNLLYGTGTDLHYFTNRGGSSGPLTSGIHGLSNHLLDTPWPKVTTATAKFEVLVRQASVDPEQIRAALSGTAPFADNVLPDTGVGPDRERLLSPLFITGDEYGTRSTTVVLIDHNDRVLFVEWAYDRTGGLLAPPRHFTFSIEPGFP